MAMADDPIAESAEAPEVADTDALVQVHDLAMKRFDSVAVPQRELREQSLAARRFVAVPGAQWEGQWGEQFENSPRPEVDKITKSLEKIETDFRENRLTVDYVPDGSGDADTADTLDGMHRADSYYFKAQQARDNAFQEGIRGGFGAYRLTTDYADPYDRDDDSQRVNPGLTIVDADQSVYFDGASILYDKSDAKWAFIVTAHPTADVEDEWGKDALVTFPTTNWNWQAEWFTPEVSRLAEYYVVEDTSDRLLIFSQTIDGEEQEQRFFKSEIEPSAVQDLLDSGWKQRTRSIRRRRVRKYLLSGAKVLRDYGYIAGDAIPIVPFYGRRDYVDNMERWRGHVAKMMDPQRIYNTRIAKLVETDSLAPYEVPIVLDEQITPAIAEEWARGNIDRHPFRRLLAARNANGDIVAAGPIGKIEPPQVAPVTGTLLQIASADLTANDDQADQVKANTSADAMDIAAARVDAKSGIYLDNMRQTIAREGEIYLGMAREVYFEAGRKVETLTMDGQDGEAVLNQLKVDDSGVFRIRNDLSRGKYKVIADVQESTATKRQKTVKQNMEIASVAVQAQDMQLAQAATLNAVMNQDGEGQQDMQAYARQRLIALGVVKPTPEEAQQLAQAAQGQQPDPTAVAMQAQAEALGAKAKLDGARAVEVLASAHLKTAQADAVGGPERAPEAPSGLSAANDGADVAAKLAGADLKSAQAEHLRSEIGRKRIMTGHDIIMGHRQQDHAEKQTESAV